MLTKQRYRACSLTGGHWVIFRHSNVMSIIIHGSTGRPEAFWGEFSTGSWAWPISVIIESRGRCIRMGLVIRQDPCTKPIRYERQSLSPRGRGGPLIDKPPRTLGYILCIRKSVTSLFGRTFCRQSFLYCFWVIFLLLLIPLSNVLLVPFLLSL